MSSSEERQMPGWLNGEFMEGLLKNSKNADSIKVRRLRTKLATASGDNYSSSIVRAEVEYELSVRNEIRTEKETLILKIGLDRESSVGEMGAKCEIFETEIAMTGALSEMRKILKDEKCKLSPEFFYAKLGDPSLIVMEDLGQLGFRIADRQAGLDLQHALAVMRGLAKLHATSVRLYEKNPAVLNGLGKGLFHDEAPVELRNVIRHEIKSLGREAANWPELDAGCSAKLLKLSELGYDKGVEYARPRENQFNVINHGDCWTNNIMFRYNEKGEVLDNTFVDFQGSFWSSPAIDILYFFVTSLDDHQFENNRQQLIDEYFNVLTGTMEKIGCTTEPPSSVTLRRSLKERELLSIIWAATALPVILIDKSQAVDLSEIFTTDDDYVYPGYKGQVYRRRVIRRLKYWNSLGLLDL